MVGHEMFEGQFVFGRPYPAIVSSVVALVSVMFVLHAALAMRKFPANFREYHNFRGHRRMFLDDDDGVFGCMSLFGCHDSARKTCHGQRRSPFSGEKWSQ